MTPSTSSESPDERTTTSPDITHENNYIKNRLHRSRHSYNSNKNSSSSSSTLTNFDVKRSERKRNLKIILCINRSRNYHHLVRYYYLMKN